MKRPLSKPPLIIAILLILLTTLFLQSRSVDLAAYARMHEAVGNYELFDAELTRDVLSARSGLLPNYDPLAADRRNLMMTYDALKKAGAAGSGAVQAALREPIELLGRAQTEKLSAMEHFESANALLRNSLLYLTVAGPQLSIPGNQNLKADESRQLSYAVLRFMNALDSDVAAEINNILDRLSAAQENDEDVRTLITHGRLIVVLAPRTDALLHQIVGVPTGSRVQNLRNAILEQSERVEKRAQVFRILLYAVALMLLCYVAIQFVQLKSVADNLARANDNLQREIGERIRLGEMARRQELQLIQKNRMAVLGMMVSGVAHEINNPNQLILVNSSLLADACRDLLSLLDARGGAPAGSVVAGLAYGEMRQQIPLLARDINDAATRIRGIVDELKYFFRPGSPGTADCFDVNDAVGRAIRFLSYQIKSRTEKFRAHLEPGLPHALGNAQQVEQIVINILVNALESLPARCRGVTISTGFDAADGSLRVTVEDEGVGISPENLSRIRDPFFTTKASTGGTGLGLAITTTLLGDLGGSLEFDSSPGKGTRALIRLRSFTRASIGGSNG